MGRSQISTLMLVMLALAGCNPQPGTPAGNMLLTAGIGTEKPGRLNPQPGTPFGNMLLTFGVGKEQAARQLAARQAADDAADDAKCRELGFKPGTEGYGNCRLQREQIRATERAAAEAEWAGIQARRSAQDAALQSTAVGNGRKVYDASECIGPVIMGECKGSILPNKAYHPTCHGQWINGQCTGPMF